jgi:hypothetical protein
MHVVKKDEPEQMPLTVYFIGHEKAEIGNWLAGRVKKEDPIAVRQLADILTGNTQIQMRAP